jgi:negative regulator of sigma E activity
MASVSVFIASGHEAQLAERSSVGTSSAYSLQQGDHQITAVGEVPPATVRRIATSMRQSQGL